MLRLTAFADEQTARAAAARAPHLALPYHDRVKSRLVAVLPDGRALAITLPRGSVMRDGAVLTGGDGAEVVVRALPEPLLRITAATPLALLLAVYHLANRHVPAQIAEDHVLIERDPVLARMLAGLGVQVAPVEAPFEPEGGAYDASHAHGGHGGGGRDEGCATLGEQLSIAAHRGRGR